MAESNTYEIKTYFVQGDSPTHLSWAVMIEVFNVREGVKVVIRIMYLITNHRGLYTVAEKSVAMFQHYIVFWL